MSASLPPTLLALTPGALRPGRTGQAERLELERRVRELGRLGLSGLLLREPALEDREFLDLARRLREALPEGWLALHDRAHLVAEVGAQGLHLGWRSLAPPEARRVVGDAVAIGLSTHVTDDPGPPDAVDLVTFGPVAATPSKQGLLEPVGAAGLAARVARGAPPLWALGGVDAGNAAACLAAGARGIVVRGALLGSADPVGALRDLQRALGEGRS